VLTGRALLRRTVADQQSIDDGVYANCAARERGGVAYLGRGIDPPGEFDDARADSANVDRAIHQDGIVPERFEHARFQLSFRINAGAARRSWWHWAHGSGTGPLLRAAPTRRHGRHIVFVLIALVVGLVVSVIWRFGRLAESLLQAGEQSAIGEHDPDCHPGQRTKEDCTKAALTALTASRPTTDHAHLLFCC
jgi:hypothetical protein